MKIKILIKQSLFPILMSVFFVVHGQTGFQTNSFFDNAETMSLSVSDITLGGEVNSPGTVKLSALPLRTVIVKETVLDENNNASFVGAYRYDGYSLVDIVNSFYVAKKNAKEFPPLVDLYIIVENDMGEKVVLSWGELYYANNQHSIIIATKVMRIVPEKTKDQWPLPVDFKLVVSNDFLTVRNISNPTKITVKTFEKKMEIEQGKFPMTAEEVDIWIKGELKTTYKKLPEHIATTLHTVFYGKGRGLHSLEPFTGYNVKEMLEEYISINKETLMNGIVLFGAEDGYRAVFTMSELCNRNDQQYSLLLFNDADQEKGKFRIYPSCDFFSDRSIKGLTDIWFYPLNLAE